MIPLFSFHLYCLLPLQSPNVSIFHQYFHYRLLTCLLAAQPLFILRILHSILSSELFFKKLKVLQLLISLLPLRFFTCSSPSVKRLSSTILVANSLLSVKTQQKWVLFYPLDINSFLFCSCLCNSPYLNVLQFILFTRGKYQEINHFLFHCCILMLSTQQLFNKYALNESMNLFITSSSSMDFEVLFFFF